MRYRAIVSLLCVLVLLLCGCAAEDALPKAEPVSADEALGEEITELINCYLTALSTHDHSEMMRCTDESFEYNRNETAFISYSRDISSFDEVIIDFESFARMADEYLISVSYELGYSDSGDEDGAYTLKRINEIFYLKYIDGGLKISSVSSLTVG